MSEPGGHAGSAECLFCRIAAGTDPARLVLTTEHVVAFLDVRPVFAGHTLLVPREHVPTLVDLPARLSAEFWETGRRLAAALPRGLGAEGTFVAINNVVSQSVPHLHLHVVPRTKGDGLRGFFWPRTRYADEAEAERTAERIRAALAEERSAP
ncbi:HIT family protein [Ruania suaedae]|uniref:HIT family protein n=1 Tax=Ruania suaedae TaxID=2897774 RepID=UPI001E5A9B8E|nr:HIT family protein [Ruania suaedae]UFU02700.1 HIT family protein [Ruania suaedae]